jgi:hypothetical protein
MTLYPAPPYWRKHRKLLSNESRHSRQCNIVIDFDRRRIPPATAL